MPGPLPRRYPPRPPPVLLCGQEEAAHIPVIVLDDVALLAGAVGGDGAAEVAAVPRPPHIQPLAIVLRRPGWGGMGAVVGQGGVGKPAAPPARGRGHTDNVQALLSSSCNRTHPASHPPACALAVCPWCRGSWARRTCSGRRPPPPPGQSAGTGSHRSAPHPAGCRAARRCPHAPAGRARGASGGERGQEGGGGGRVVGGRGQRRRSLA